MYEEELKKIKKPRWWGHRFEEEERREIKKRWWIFRMLYNKNCYFKGFIYLVYLVQWTNTYRTAERLKIGIKYFEQKEQALKWAKEVRLNNLLGNDI